MSKAVVKSNVEAVLRKLNTIPMNHSDGYSSEAKNHLREITSTIYGYEIYIKNDHLKIGGEDDYDSNDSTLFRDIAKYFEKEIKAYNKDIVIKGIQNEYKGFYSVVLSLKSDKAKMKQLKKLGEQVKKIEDKISDLNKSVFVKIKGSSSKTKTCSHCQSEITLSVLTKINCPACAKPLYSKTEENKVNELKSKISVFNAEIQSLLT